ncbi:MAG: RluA family pseudouridine synthase [Bacteroidia bacterium]
MKISQQDVLFEDNHLIAIHKPAGILSQGDKTGDDSIIEIVKSFLKNKYNKPGNVYLANLHRLDRPVQGVLLFAKTSKAAERMSKAFREGKVNKTYLAVVNAKLKSKKGEIVSYILKDTKNNTVNSFKTQKGDSKKAQTIYKVIDQQNDKTLLELRPITGRSHQLRVHCAAELKTPILGDVKYGSNHKTHNRSLFLLAHCIEFKHPVSKQNQLIYSRIPNNAIWQSFQL